MTRRAVAVPAFALRAAFSFKLSQSGHDRSRIERRWSARSPRMLGAGCHGSTTEPAVEPAGPSVEPADHGT
jgi:hypothetical protein